MFRAVRQFFRGKSELEQRASEFVGFVKKIKEKSPQEINSTLLDILNHKHNPCCQYEFLKEFLNEWNNVHSLYHNQRGFFYWLFSFINKNKQMVGQHEVLSALEKLDVSKLGAISSFKRYIPIIDLSLVAEESKESVDLLSRILEGIDDKNLYSMTEILIKASINAIKNKNSNTAIKLLHKIHSVLENFPKKWYLTYSTFVDVFAIHHTQLSEEVKKTVREIQLLLLEKDLSNNHLPSAETLAIVLHKLSRQQLGENEASRLNKIFEAVFIKACNERAYIFSFAEQMSKNIGESAIRLFSYGLKYFPKETLENIDKIDFLWGHEMKLVLTEGEEEMVVPAIIKLITKFNLNRRRYREDYKYLRSLLSMAAVMGKSGVVDVLLGAASITDCTQALEAINKKRSPEEDQTLTDTIRNKILEKRIFLEKRENIQKETNAPHVTGKSVNIFRQHHNSPGTEETEMREMERTTDKTPLMEKKNS